MDTEIRNATIKSTELGLKDHGCLSFFLYLDYGGAGQGFGGYVLDEPIHKNGKFIKRIGSAFGMEIINQILKVLEVNSWEKLPGTPCRAKTEHHKVHAIGHYLKDNWFDIEALAKEYFPKDGE